MVDLAPALPLADTVLFEGYVLYPYRANDAKNQVRWQFGVLMPPGFAELDPSERAWLQTDLLVEGGGAQLTVRCRFLHVRRRTVEQLTPDGPMPVASLDVGDATYLPCDEAAVVEADLHLTLPVSAAASSEHDIVLSAGTETEILMDADGRPVGRLAREWSAIEARVAVVAEPLPGPYRVRRVNIRVDNLTPWTASNLGPQPTRPDALRRALVAAHLVAGVDGASIVSQLDPPEWARGYVAACTNIGVFPVLAGPTGRSDLVFASPIILYDHAEVAPESTVAFCDSTEMDEMLTLRAMTLTDAEKRQARGSDVRAAGIVDQVDHLPPELLDRLHGALRSMTTMPRPSGMPDLPVADIDRPPWWDPGADASVDPETDEIIVGGRSLRRDVRVRLRPGGKRADAQDMFLEGRAARIEAVLRDVDGNTHLAVALEDLLEDGFNPHGRYLYFAPDEVELIEIDA